LIIWIKNILIPYRIGGNAKKTGDKQGFLLEGSTGALSRRP